MELIKATIGEFLENRARLTPDSIGLIYNDEQYSWSEINKITDHLSEELHNLGVKKGDRVGLFGMNSASWVFHFFAAQKLGAVSVLFSTCYREPEVERSINLTKVKYLFYSEGYKGESYAKIIANLREKRLPSMKLYLYMEKSEKIWREKLSQSLAFKTSEKIMADDTAMIIFTSGTTSDSKGVMLSHYNVVNNARQTVESVRWNIDDKMLVTVPLFHCFGMTSCILTSVSAGFPIVLMGHYATIEVCEKIQQHKCTILNGVPSMFLAMLRNEERKSYDISSIKSGIIAGSAINSSDYMEICQMFDNIKLQPSYGQSEASPCITITGYDDPIELKAVSAGRAIEHVQIRVRRLDDRSTCESGCEGEIEVKGYNVMKGYVGSSCETDKVITVDGWLKTGDLGFIDQDKNLHITGRCKNIIIRGGENVSPVEVEDSIKEVIKSRDVKVFGVESDVVQEEIVACIECEGSPQLKKTIQNHLKSRLCGYKIPRYIYFMESLPRLGSGKIDEKLLKSEITSKIIEEKSLRSRAN